MPVSVTHRALWYIESHLNGDLSLEAIADAAGVSRFHMSRAFTLSTGLLLSGYIRARRLSEAAKTLAQGAPDILSVALDNGYESHEGFTRAFRQQFDVTPDQLRAQARTDRLALQEALSMEHPAVIALGAPRIVARGALLLFGLNQRCERLGDPNIPSQWARFMPHLGHIGGQIGRVAYGVIHSADDAGDYDYMCGVEVRAVPAEPAEFTALTLPAQTYAVFEQHGHISTIVSTWKGIWEEGLSHAGRKAADGPSFERYGEQFDGRTGLGGFEIWVPVVA